jgi:transcriptional regulator with XRE-family HTH domain
MVESKETIGMRLKRLRKAADMTQAGLALAAGVPLGSLRNWEQSRSRLPADKAVALAAALGVDIGEIVGGDKPPAKGRRKKGGSR